MTLNKQELNSKQWKLTKLSDLGKLTDGDWILAENYSDSGTRLLQIGDIGIGKFLDKSRKFISNDTVSRLRCSIVKQGKDILISRMPEPIGRACLSPITPYPYIVAVDISIFSTKDEITDKKFIVFLLNHEKTLNQVKQLVSGSTRERISRKNLESITVMLPPVPEQQKISSILSKVDELIQKTDQIIEQTQLLKKGLLLTLFTGIISNSKKRIVQYGTKWMTAKIPMQWSYKKLNEVAKFRQGLQIAKTNRYREGGKNRIKLIKIIDFYADRESDEFIDIPSSERSVICSSDDIIIARTGNTLGLVLTNVEGVFHNNTFALDYNREIFDKMFFYYMLTTPYVQLYMRIISTRTGQPDLTHNEFSHLVVFIPPMYEQRKIALILSNVDELIETQKLRRREYEALKKGLMQKLLTGKIRVKV